MQAINEKYECILLDLDGTLVDSAKNRFLLQNTIALYKRFSRLFGRLRTVPIVRNSLNSMILNTKASGVTNYERLIQFCHELSGVPTEFISYELGQYYNSDFLKWSHLFKPVANAQEFVKLAKFNKKKLYLWTNPIWPEFNVKKRLEWGGFDSQDFIGMTHSQNSIGCKPHLEYFKNSLEHFSLDPQKCVYIGDSIKKDSPARELGIETIILSGNKANAWQAITNDLFRT